MTALTKTTVGLNLLRDHMRDALDFTITHIALGTGSTAPAASDTQLQTETFRKAITTYAAGGSTGESILTMYLGVADSAPTIAEVGIFANGTAAANSGVLVARGLYSNTHDATNTIQFSWDNTFS